MSKNSLSAQPINLALQGGGAHGAFTWGVLDRLLEVKELTIEAISGTSAGAMNGAVLVNGYCTGGRDQAKEKLHDFWQRIAEASAFNLLQKHPIAGALTGWNLDDTPAYYLMDAFSRFVSPYDANPLDINPLKTVLEQTLDIDALHACTSIKLFVTATHVESGQPRSFGCADMSIDVLLASSCLPQLFQAVEIDGEHYWDGGYMGNPAIWPLIYQCGSEDIILIQINPIQREGVPKQSVEIVNRLNEITFNASLIAEMRAIDFVQRLIHSGKLKDNGYKDINMHLISSSEAMHDLNASSKLNTDWAFFMHLRDLGRQSAEDWLLAHQGDIGKQSTINIRDEFLRGAPHA